LLVGDARLPRDVTAAVADAARLVDPQALRLQGLA
jgi:hypothetical protein